MKNKALFCAIAFLPALFVSTLASSQEEQMLKVATFNVSMEATNYKALGMEPSDQVLQYVLSTGEHSQVKNIAEIIQRVNPDILMLNEFDYIADKRKGVDAFVKNYLNVSQGGLEPVDYPYTYVATVNTGEPTKFENTLLMLMVFAPFRRLNGITCLIHRFLLFPMRAEVLIRASHGTT